MPNTPKVKAAARNTLFQLLKDADVDIGKLLEDVELNPRYFEKENCWIPYDKYSGLLERSAFVLGENYLGIELARKMQARDYGPLGYISLSSRNLGDAIENLVRYYFVVTTAFSMNLTVEGRFATIFFEPERPSFAGFRHANELGDAFLVNNFQALIGEKIPPVEIHCTHSFEGDPARHEAYFGCPVKFNKERAEIILPREILALPIGTADRKLLKVLTQHCEDVRKATGHGDSDLLTQLEQLLLDLLPSGRARSEIMAAELGMSDRTLARRLAKSNTSFNETLDTLRRGLALRYIRQPELQLTDVVFLLGYANQSSFSVAFKRWTGKTPRASRTG
jgi:AraC-like DNA-binding protein